MTSKNISKTIQKQREFFASGTTKNLSFRILQLKRLKEVIIAYEGRIYEALKKDLGKCEFEAYTTEVGFCLKEINYVIKKLRKWTKPERKSRNILFPFASNKIVSEPFGVTLIMAPWNYPFQLVISPLIGSMAAGNCAVLKPSEISSNSAEVIKEMFSEYFQNDYISVINGGVEISQALLKEKFDYIFFTGSTTVGKIVMEEGAKNLTPMTLELGGKSPCIITEDSDIKVSAKRIAWGKWLNAGQTCIAPDYVFVNKKVKAKFIKQVIKEIIKFYGADPSRSSDYGRIISDAHFKRLSSYLKEGTILHGGNKDAKLQYISPTIIENANLNSKIMNEEIFGPILPIMSYSKISDVLKYINQREKPLSLYLFTKDKKIQKRILKETSSGSVCINDVVVQLLPFDLAFGGVGNSGFGKYHGKASFDSFSNKKSVMIQSFFLDIKFRYPPYDSRKMKFAKRILK